MTTQFSTEISGLPNSRETQVEELSNGDTFNLRIAPVVKSIEGAKLRMLAYNGSIPGPVLKVRQGSEINVHVTNDGDTEATVHWHGLLVENQFDGTHETQSPVPARAGFTYRLRFFHPGIYWYHPHIREDYGQELGLYGNILVVPADPDYWPPANREVVLTLDDILIEDGKVAPFSPSEPTYVAMGRFGNVLLTNGEAHRPLTAQAGEVVRFYLTNTANTRIFNVGMPGARMKLVGGDSGRVEMEQFVDNIILAPSERYVVDVLFDVPGRVVLKHHTPERVYELATIDVTNDAAEPSLRKQFEILRRNAEMAAERKRIASYLEASPDKTLSFLAEMDLQIAEGGSDTVFSCPMHPEIVGAKGARCPKCNMKLVPLAGLRPPADHQMMHHAAPMHGHHDGIEWEDGMVEINRRTTPANMRWKIVDRDTKAENRRINWRFQPGAQVKIRLVNEMESDHPMHHPFHIHGAGRFLVLSRDGAVEPNLVWKDTVLVLPGQTMDILLDVTNPGRWMAHCHISEHHESGMMFSFDVAPRIVSVVVLGEQEETSVLALAANLLREVNDPLAAAIFEAVPDIAGLPGDVGDVRSVPGKGVTGSVNGHTVVFGNSSFLSELGTSVGNFGEWTEQFVQHGQRVLFVAVDREPKAFLKLSPNY